MLLALTVFGAAFGLSICLPALLKADWLSIVVVNLRSITRYPKLDFVGHLSRYSAEVSTWAFEAHDWEAGARIVDIADKTNSDLIVTGAYGHSQWREFFVGGATRHVLKYMTVPVLMVH